MGHDAGEDEWQRARALVAATYAAITDDVFRACNDPGFNGVTPFGPSQHVYGEVSDTAKICAVMVGLERLFASSWGPVAWKDAGGVGGGGAAWGGGLDVVHT